MDGTRKTSASRAKKWRESLTGSRLEEYRAKTRAASNSRYHALKGDPEFVAKERERKRELQRKRRANPTTAAVMKEQSAKYRGNPEYKAKQAAFMAAWRAANKGAIKEYQAHWKAENADHVRDYLKTYQKQYTARPDVRTAKRARHLKQNYGISLEQFSALWNAQDGQCAICEVELVAGGRESVSACVDHNHDTGDIRGLLCRQCNHGIGHMKDSPEVLERAAAYLRDRGYYGKAKPHVRG